MSGFAFFRDRSGLGRARAVLIGPHMFAFVPAISLGSYWLGGEAALAVAAIVLPLMWLLLADRDADISPNSGTLAKGMVPPDQFEPRAEKLRHDAPSAGKTSAIFLVEIDEFAGLSDRCEPAATDKVLATVANRIVEVLRDADSVARVGDARFAICLSQVKHLDLETCIQVSGRLQEAIEEPIALDGLTLYVTASIGVCTLARAPGATGRDWLNAALVALQESQKRGNGSVRVYSPELQNRLKQRANLREDVVEALEHGHILPWFQPQISTDTGKVSGFEALARWIHPERGPISPAEFLPAIEDAGMMERLAEIMVTQSLTALKAWDSAGVVIPQVGVNFSAAELSNPRLVEKLQWEFDRFDLTPNRLAVEVLETVVVDMADDTIARNIQALTELGCTIDMDDFGTGHASIASLRRFGVNRIKIDRSFVMKADRDPEQQRMISAILTMSERLGLATLAEGVETVGEHALLAQLGCDHVQGYGISRPMPFEKTLDWIHSHDAKLQDTPQLPGQRFN